METLNDIVREVAAEMLNTSMQEITAERIHGWATRLGATCQESRQVGNAAKMREALIKILGLTDHLQRRFALRKLITEVVLELEQIAENALSTPPRNCDLYSHDEALRIWSSLPESKENGCFDVWLFAEAKGDANK